MGKSRGAGFHGRCATVASEPFRGAVGSPSGARLGAWQRQGSEPTKPAAAHCSSARAVPSPSPVRPVGVQDFVRVAIAIWGTAQPPRRRRPKGSAWGCDHFANDSEGGQGGSQGPCGRTWVGLLYIPGARKNLRAFPLIFAIGLGCTIVNRKTHISLKETEKNLKKLSTISWGSAPDPELFCPSPIED